MFSTYCLPLTHSHNPLDPFSPQQLALCILSVSLSVFPPKLKGKAQVSIPVSLGIKHGDWSRAGSVKGGCMVDP